MFNSHPVEVYFDFNPPILTNTTENLMVSELPFVDFDKDGVRSEEDCDDTNGTIFPNALEIANNQIDEDCDGADLIVTGTHEITGNQLTIFPNPVQQQLFINQTRTSDLIVKLYSTTDYYWKGVH